MARLEVYSTMVASIRKEGILSGKKHSGLVEEMGLRKSVKDGAESSDNSGGGVWPRLAPDGRQIHEPKTWKRWRLLVPTAFAFSLLITAVYLHPVPLSTMTEWNVKSLPVSGIFEIDSALDSEGNVHLVCCSVSGLVYLTEAGGEWRSSRLGTGSEASSSSTALWGRYCSIAIDAEDCIHIASLLADSAKTLVYLDRENDASWETEIVDTGVWGWPISIAADSRGHAHVSYCKNSSVILASNSGGEWQGQVIHPSSNGEETTVLVDNQDKVHVFTGDTTVCDITVENGTQTTDPIYYWDLCGGRISAALDSEGFIHVAFLGSSKDNAANWGLQHAVNRTGSWEFTFIDGLSSFVGQECNVRIDSQDGLHISYQDFENHQQKYARNTDGRWRIVELTKSGNSFWQLGANTLVIDGEDDAHVFFSGSDASSVKYATNEFPPMIIRLVLYVTGAGVMVVGVAYAFKIGRMRAEKREREDDKGGPFR